ncbi:hypothetical protein BH09SUM1_BH09SUM1_33170 [soil metagenome]
MTFRTIVSPLTPPPPNQNRGSDQEWVWIVSTLLVQLVASLLALKLMGAVFTSSDEYCRLVYAMQWSEHPFFATHDHVWLGGNFWLLGSMLCIVNRPVLVGILHGVLSGLLAALLGYSLLRRSGFPREVSLFGIVLFASRPVVMALSKSPQPDMLFVAMLFGVLLCAQATFGGGIPRYRPWLCGTACVIIAQTLRYEGWFLTVPWGIVTFILFCRALRSRDFRTTMWMVCAGMALLAFPLMWLESSRSELGSLTGFLTLMRGMLSADTPELHSALFADRLAYYPYYTIHQMPVLIVPGLVGIAMAFRTPTWGARSGVGILALFWISLIVNTTRIGFGNNWTYRLAIMCIGPLALYAGPGLMAICASLPRRVGPAIVGGLLLCDLSFSWSRMDTLFLSAPPDHDIVRLSGRAGKAASRSGTIRYLALDMRSTPDYWGYEEWVAKVHAGPYIRVRPIITDDDWVKTLGDPVYRYALADRESLSPGFKETSKRGKYSLRVRKSSPPPE